MIIVPDRTTFESAYAGKAPWVGYWFDFGDDWWHQIDVVAVDDMAPKDIFPQVTKRVGESRYNTLKNELTIIGHDEI